MALTLEQLKGGALMQTATENTLDDELSESPPTAAEIKSMPVKELNALRADHDLDVPGWDSLSKPQKQAELIKLFWPDTAPAPTLTAGSTVTTTIAEDETDPLVKIAHQIENLKSEEQAISMFRELSNDASLSAFKQGGILVVMEDNGWFGQYDSLKAFAKEEFNLEYRSMRYRMQLYRGLLDAGISYDLVKKAGWLKTIIMLPVLDSENVEGWVERAVGVNCETLKAMVAQELHGEKLEDNTPISVTKTKAFKLHADQYEMVAEALAEAKSKYQTDHDAVALEGICGEFLSGGKKVKTIPMTTKQFLQHLLDQHNGDQAAAAGTLFGDDFETLFASIDVTVAIHE